MKYAVFLRGINVGGHNIIKMADLREALSHAGFSEVKTYIQSGNVAIESAEKHKEALEKKVEKILSDSFRYDARVMILSQAELEVVATHAPANWKKAEDLRCYVGFIKQPHTAEEIAAQISVNPEVDELATGPGVVYMTTTLEGRTRSRFTKMVGTPLYRLITIRNLATVQKMLELLKS